jgi:putative (di)nucleoside polyphosphate hydrolase
MLVNKQNQLFLGQRIHQQAWQFPQGGVKEGESTEEALYRELHEEIGLKTHQVAWLGETQHWLKYRLPKKLIRFDSQPVCIGQKQKWIALRFIDDDSTIDLDATFTPEFESWKWVSYWYPLREVVSFKREVYRQALKELAPIIFGIPARHTLIALDPFYT